MLFIKANAVILKMQGYALFLFPFHETSAGPDFDNGRMTGLMKLEGVSDEILEKLAHQQWISFDHWQRINLNRSFRLFDPDLQIGKDFVGDL